MFLNTIFILVICNFEFMGISPSYQIIKLAPYLQDLNTEIDQKTNLVKNFSRLFYVHFGGAVIAILLYGIFNSIFWLFYYTCCKRNSKTKKYKTEQLVRNSKISQYHLNEIYTGPKFDMVHQYSQIVQPFAQNVYHLSLLFHHS